MRSIHYFYDEWLINEYDSDVLCGFDPEGTAIIEGSRYTGEWVEIDGLKPGDPGFDERKEELQGWASVSHPI